MKLLDCLSNINPSGTEATEEQLNILRGTFGESSLDWLLCLTAQRNLVGGSLSVNDGYDPSGWEGGSGCLHIKSSTNR